MSQTIPIYFKVTGEPFDVPYQIQMTIRELIEYVCKQSGVLSNTDPDNYYMAINNNDVLDDHRTIEEIGLSQPNRFYSLTVCIKTRILIERILKSHNEFWQIPSASVSQKIQSEKTPSSITQQQAPTSIESKLNDNDAMKSEIHILVCGGPKVGKSSLINALCGCPVAKTGAIGLDLCTQKTSYYQLDNIFFWDTPGIQNWSDLDIDSYLNSTRLSQTPLCMFYCASPGSFTKLKQLDKLLDECIHQRNIFCVLVVTNMFAHVDRQAILNEFKKLLGKYIDNEQQIREKNGVSYYGKVGLCTMVNSQEYLDDDRKHPQQGINELVFAVTKSLSETHQLAGWLKTIEQNRQFWFEKQEELYRLTEKPPGTCLSDMI